MPPKKATAAAPSKKTEQKKKEKVIEDKTFGIKNKKGAKQQKFIQQVEKQVKSGGIHPRKADDPNVKKLEKEKKLKEQQELALIFKPVQKVDKGTDPKSVICAFFKSGQCTKGDKCKFSHDLSIERKAEKRSLYCDVDKDFDKEADTMDTWDENKLKLVVEKKHDSHGSRPTTDIICKYFLEAVENAKYGWFWECPLKQKCIYRHALPPNFVLKKDIKKEEQKVEISLEDLIETERAKLGANQVKIELITFLAWKKRKLKEKELKSSQEEAKKLNDYKAGRQVGISGREMFHFNPDLITGDGSAEDGDEAIASYECEEDGENVVYRDLDINELLPETSQVDITITNSVALSCDIQSSTSVPQSVVIDGDQAMALTINENLFIEDLDAVDDELENLNLDE